MKRIATDVGGTFTDIVCYDEENKEMVIDKAQTTPGYIENGVLNATKKIDVNPLDIKLFIHGSTVATNTLVENKGSKTALITTKGFKDILEIRRADRPDNAVYDIMWEKPESLVPRNLRFESSERIKANGEILRKVDRNEIEEIISKLKKNEIESIAVSLLHSYAFEKHEIEIKKIIKQLWPEVHISLSNQVAREIREYERTSTTVIDAKVKKKVIQYLNKLIGRLKEELGIKCDVLIASAVGGVTTEESIEKAPIQMISSGPAGGAIGAKYLSDQTGIKNIITADVGGTTYDVSLIVNGKNQIRSETEIAGYAAKVQSIDVRNVGAGGGSLAFVDQGGMLQVGPQSAGADPGPMCYGKGGEQPTVTDAALVTGLLSVEHYAEGQIYMYTELAKKGIEEIATKINTGLYETAEGILTIARNKMADIARNIIIGGGNDPRDFAMLSYGGGGGLFAAEIAQILGIPKVIVPNNPAVFSAWGMLAADVVNTFSKSYVNFVEDIDLQQINKMYSKMIQSGRETIIGAKIDKENMAFKKSVDVRYEGQGHELEVLLPDNETNMKEYIKHRFEQLHQEKYGYKMNNLMETVTFRLKAIGQMEKVLKKEIETGNNDSNHAISRIQKVFLSGKHIDCNVYDRSKLCHGNVIVGPAIVDESNHITIIMENQKLELDRYGNLIITRGNN